MRHQKLVHVNFENCESTALEEVCNEVVRKEIVNEQRVEKGTDLHNFNATLLAEDKSLYAGLPL